MDNDLTKFEANFSVLDRYGTDVTKEEYITNPAIGREQQLKDVILILLTPEKSAILIGEPGVGKTAIVEGIAYKIQKGDVPPALQGYTIINIKTASLLGTMPNGESKVQKMIDELKTKEKVILFIDEIHMLIGATETSSVDFANIFKEGLGRGSIKVIGATTSKEYETYILRDKAFNRRFQKVEVPEPTREETIKIMMGSYPKFEKQVGKKLKYTSFIKERIMTFLVDITSKYKRYYGLGSMYPDVSLTLLKQAFSYTVYDDRPFVDIFDIRKAIENSKNIYPDVIRKGLEEFDVTFKDLMLEEKGEKPIEEWRKDNTLTRQEIENGKNNNVNADNISIPHNDNISSNQSYKNDNRSVRSVIESNNYEISKLKSKPDMINGKTTSSVRPVKSILVSSEKLSKSGTINVSSSIREKLNKTKNAKKMDDFLLSDNIGVITKKKDTGPIIPDKVIMTEELKKDIGDSFLLGRPISSTLDDVKEEKKEDNNVKYRIENSKGINRNEGKRMWDDNRRPERIDISAQNFDKYNNFFSQGMNNQEEEENRRRIDMLMGNGNSAPVTPQSIPDNNQMGPSMNNQMGYMPPANNQMGPPMNNQMGYMPPVDNQMGPPMNNQMGYMPPMNNQMGPPMNNQMGYMPPVDNQMGPPMNNQMGYMPPANNQMGVNPQINNGYNPANDFGINNSFGGTENSGGETLFGAPMYGSSDDEDKFRNIPDIYGLDKAGSNYNNNMMNNSPSGSFFGNNNDQNSIDRTQNLMFGAPMYGNVSNLNQNNNNSLLDNSVDVFGQLISDTSENMRIKNGKIVDEFPTFDKINNLSNIKSVISDVRDTGNLNKNNDNILSKSDDSNKVVASNEMYGNIAENMGAVQNQNAQSDDKKWTFIGQNDQYPNANVSTFKNNILDDVKKEDNTISPMANNTLPTSNKDYYEDMKTGDFVNLTELNSGKIKEEDTNKYMGVQISANKPQFDLNLEENKEEEKDFDDFFE